MNKNQRDYNIKSDEKLKTLRDSAVSYWKNLGERAELSSELVDKLIENEMKAYARKGII